MTCRKIIYIITSSWLISCSAFCLSAGAQTPGEIAEVKSLFTIQASAPDYRYARENTNEIQMLFSGLFLFYKHFISSQDGMSCTFTPSCSEYGMEAVKKQGLVAGAINTLDRLTRCNGLSPGKYPLHPDTHLFYDPVE